VPDLIYCPVCDEYFEARTLNPGVPPCGHGEEGRSYQPDELDYNQELDFDDDK